MLPCVRVASKFWDLTPKSNWDGQASATLTSGTSCGVCRACCLSKPFPPEPSNHLQLAMAESRLAPCGPCVLWRVARRKGCQPLPKCFPLYLQPSDLFPNATSRECPPVSPTRREGWKSQGARTWLVSIDQTAVFFQDHPVNKEETEHLEWLQPLVPKRLWRPSQ